ncbi:hypothetical protein GZD43_004769 [Vibrio alginolyticus]|nr:hypothetical protein [Vibrio alginolyticus]
MNLFFIHVINYSKKHYSLFKHNGISICQRWVSSMYEKADKSKDEFRITLKRNCQLIK